MVITAYLDQNAWINLSRAHYGRSEDWKSAHDAVLDAVRTGSARFPLSMSNVSEIAKRQDDASRGRLVDFVLEVWNADAIRSWADMLAPEARNAVRRLTKREPIDLTKHVFGKSIGYTVGGTPTWPSKQSGAKLPTPEQMRQMIELLLSPKSLEPLKNAGIAAVMRETVKNAAADAARIQEAIDRDYAHNDKMKRRDIAEARFARDVMLEPFVKALPELASDPQAVLDHAFASKESIRALRRDMPTHNTFFELNHARNTSRRYHPNDIMDSAIFSAIPYCDVVFTERQWCNFAKSAGLDTLNETTMVHSPSGLAAALAS